MALNNFDNLQSKIIDQSHRNDLTPDRLADFIRQAEQEFYANAIEPLQIRDIEQTSNQDTVVDSGALALPSGYQSMRSILIDDKSSTIDSWNNAGGIGILHTPKNSSKSINQLMEILSKNV